MTERLYYYAQTLNDSSHEPGEDDRVLCAKEQANLVSSLCEDGKHRPVLDIDMECRLVPSSTPGHYHLYIEHPMEPGAYFELIAALGKAGILSHFYVKAAQIRGATFVRPEWVKKPDPLLDELKAGL